MQGESRQPLTNALPHLIFLRGAWQHDLCTTENELRRARTVGMCPSLFFCWSTAAKPLCCTLCEENLLRTIRTAIDVLVLNKSGEEGVLYAHRDNVYKKRKVWRRGPPLTQQCPSSYNTKYCHPLCKLTSKTRTLPPPTQQTFTDYPPAAADLRPPLHPKYCHRPLLHAAAFAPAHERKKKGQQSCCHVRETLGCAVAAAGAELRGACAVVKGHGLWSACEGMSVCVCVCVCAYTFVAAVQKYRSKHHVERQAYKVDGG